MTEVGNTLSEILGIDSCCRGRFNRIGLDVQDIEMRVTVAT